MNETLKVLETRRSCRNFDKERMVSEEDIQAVVKAGTYAATGMGRQSPIIIAVTNKELRDRLSAENAKIISLELDEERAKQAQDFINQSAYREQILWSTCNSDCSCRQRHTNLSV